MATLNGLSLARAALDYLEQVPSKHRKQIIRKIEALAADPHANGTKPLKGTAGTSADGEDVYRERSGDYRILYVVRKNPPAVVILDIDHRKDVYR